MPDLKMPDINRVQIAGNLTRDPELIQTGSGKTVCKIGIAQNRKYGEREEVLYINATCWEKQAEWCGQHLKKGYPVYIEGRLRQNEWQDRQSGETRRTIEITADRIQQLSWENIAGGGEPKPKPKKREVSDDDVDFGDDLPF